MRTTTTAPKDGRRAQRASWDTGPLRTLPVTSAAEQPSVPFTRTFVVSESFVPFVFRKRDAAFIVHERELRASGKVERLLLNDRLKFPIVVAHGTRSVVTAIPKAARISPVGDAPSSTHRSHTKALVCASRI